MRSFKILECLELQGSELILVTPDFAGTLPILDAIKKLSLGFFLGDSTAVEVIEASRVLLSFVRLHSLACLERAHWTWESWTMWLVFPEDVYQCLKLPGEGCSNTNSARICNGRNRKWIQNILLINSVRTLHIPCISWSYYNSCVSSIMILIIYLNKWLPCNIFKEPRNQFVSQRVKFMQFLL